MSKEVHINELLKDKDNFVNNPYKQKELQDDLKMIKDADAKYSLLKDKYDIDMENMTEAEKQKIVSQIEGDDFISGLDMGNTNSNTFDFNPSQDMSTNMANMNINNNPGYVDPNNMYQQQMGQMMHTEYAQGQG